jgi:hypothetical protein
MGKNHKSINKLINEQNFKKLGSTTILMKGIIIIKGT